MSLLHWGLCYLMAQPSLGSYQCMEEFMNINLRRSIASRAIGSAFLLIMLAQCGTNPEAAKFFDANNVARVSVPHRGAIDLDALDCSANQYAIENGFSYFARADVTMRVRGGFAQPPAVLTNSDGDKRVFSEYGFYRSEADWNSAKDDRIGTLESVQVYAERC